MASNPNILLQGIVPDLGRAVSQGLDIGQSIRNAPIMNRLLKQQETQGQQAISQNKQQAQLAEINQVSTIGGVLSAANEGKEVSNIDEALSLGQFLPEGVQITFDPNIETEQDVINEVNQHIRLGNTLSSKSGASAKGQGGRRDFVGAAVDAQGQPMFDPNGSPLLRNYANTLSINAAGETSSTDTGFGGTFTEGNNPLVASRVELADRQALSKVSDVVIEQEGKKKKVTQLQGDAAKQSQVAFDGAELVRERIGIYDDVISAINEGAGTGQLEKMLPTVRDATVKLKNAMQRAGLNTLKGVTLGAISATELDLVLNADIPEGLSEPALLELMTKKKGIQEKLLTELQDMGDFLAQPGSTVASWNNLQRNKGAKPLNFSSLGDGGQKSGGRKFKSKKEELNFLLKDTKGRL